MRYTAYVHPKEMPFCLALLMTIGKWDVSGKNDVYTRDGYGMEMAETAYKPTWTNTLKHLTRM